MGKAKNIIAKMKPPLVKPNLDTVAVGKQDKWPPSHKNEHPTAIVYNSGLCLKLHIKQDVNIYRIKIHKYIFLNPYLSYSVAHITRDEPLQRLPTAPAIVIHLSLFIVL